MPDAPHELRTSRLSLRKPVHSSADAVLSLLSNPDVVHHNRSDLVTDPSEASALIDRWLRHWNQYGFGYYCIFDKEGSLIGNCGVRHMRVHGHDVLNLMYRFLPRSWGKGYATEAAAAVLSWVHGNCPEATVLARVRPQNVRSHKVATKIGLRRDPRFDDMGEDGIDWAYTNRSNEP